jgi:hypothetical protein
MSVRSSCRDEGMITDKTTRLERGIDKTLQWLDSNLFEETKENEVKKKELEGSEKKNRNEAIAVLRPIFHR